MTQEQAHKRLTRIRAEALRNKIRFYDLAILAYESCQEEAGFYSFLGLLNHRTMRYELIPYLEHALKTLRNQ